MLFLLGYALYLIILLLLFTFNSIISNIFQKMFPIFNRNTGPYDLLYRVCVMFQMNQRVQKNVLSFAAN